MRISDWSSDVCSSDLYIVTRILGGDWPEGNRVPSENELTRELSVSRMTVHRALRELTTEGWLERVQGAGTFVAPPKPQSEVLDIRNIAEEIAARGHRHSAVEIGRASWRDRVCQYV